MLDSKYITSEEQLYFSINTLIYPVKAIMKAAYIYTSNFYIGFDYENETYISATFKSKKKVSQDELEKWAGEFFNELLNQVLRIDIQNRTKDLRQLILGRALYTECIEVENPVSTVESNIAEEFTSSDKNYVNDTDNIGQPWNNDMRYIKDDRSK